MEGMPEVIPQALPCRSNVHLYLHMGAPDPSEPVPLIYQTIRSYITQDCNRNMCSPPWEPHIPKLFSAVCHARYNMYALYNTPDPLDRNSARTKTVEEILTNAAILNTVMIKVMDTWSLLIITRQCRIPQDQFGFRFHLWTITIQIHE